MWTLERVITLCWLIVLAYEDVRYRSITLKSIVIGMLAGCMLIGIEYMNQHVIGREIWNHMLGMGVGIVFIVISRISAEQIGYGDSLVMVVLGIVLGFYDLIEIIFVASSASVLYVCAHRLFCKLRHKSISIDTIPFIPFLLTGYIGVNIW